MNWLGWLAVGSGAAIGAWARWGLGLWLNGVLTQLPVGTLAANLGGGYIIGLAVAFFTAYPDLSPEWRLFLVTGFLGGLTTFSTFSADTVRLLRAGDYGPATAYIALSVAVCDARGGPASCGRRRAQ